jgi:hypothetical protein
MASGDGGFDPGRDVGRANDVCTHRRHAGLDTRNGVRTHPKNRIGNDGISDYSTSDRLASSEDSPRPRKLRTHL